MNRLTSTMSADFTAQFRNKLYYLGVGGSVLFGLILSQIAFLVDLARGVPVVVLLITGGGGLLYVGVALLIMSRSAPPAPFDVPMLLVGIAATGILYTLLGIIISVRYDSITDMIVPLITFGMVLQLPFLHFLELLEHPLWLIVPTSAPMVLMQGAFRSAAAWEWVYGIGYTAAWTVALAYWAYASFRTYIVMRMG